MHPSAASISVYGPDIPRKRNSRWRPLTADFYFRFWFWS